MTLIIKSLLIIHKEFELNSLLRFGFCALCLNLVNYTLLAQKISF